MSDISDMLMGLKVYRVSGNFSSNNKQLTSLEGSPEEVGGDFYCFNNKLESLEGCPKKVGGDFICIKNSHQFTKEEVRALCNVGGDIYV